MAKENLQPLLGLGGNIVTKDELLNALFASEFNGNTIEVSIPLSWKTGTESIMMPP